MTAAELYEIVRQPWWDGVRPEGIQWKPDNNGETYFRVDDWFRIDTDHAIMLHEAAAVRAIGEVWIRNPTPDDPEFTVRYGFVDQPGDVFFDYEWSVGVTLIHALDDALKQRNAQ